MYKQLADWNKKLTGLEILLFPSDEFGGQELPSAEIAPFLQGFKLTKDLPLDGNGGCRLMEKVMVNGDDTHPVFALGKEKYPGDIAWNFAGIPLRRGWRLRRQVRCQESQGAWQSHRVALYTE